MFDVFINPDNQPALTLYFKTFPTKKRLEDVLEAESNEADDPSYGEWMRGFVDFLGTSNYEFKEGLNTIYDGDQETGLVTINKVAVYD